MGLIAVSLEGSPIAHRPDDPGEHDGPVAALRHLLAALTGPDPVDAPLAIVAGTVAGAGAPGTARCAAIGLSPLSGGVAETRPRGPTRRGCAAPVSPGSCCTGRPPSRPAW